MCRWQSCDMDHDDRAQKEPSGHGDNIHFDMHTPAEREKIIREFGRLLDELGPDTEITIVKSKP